MAKARQDAVPHLPDSLTTGLLRFRFIVASQPSNKQLPAVTMQLHHVRGTRKRQGIVNWGLSSPVPGPACRPVLPGHGFSCERQIPVAPRSAQGWKETAGNAVRQAPRALPSPAPHRGHG